MCVSALREWPHVFCFQLVIFLLTLTYSQPPTWQNFGVMYGYVI